MKRFSLVVTMTLLASVAFAQVQVRSERTPEQQRLVDEMQSVMARNPGMSSREFEQAFEKDPVDIEWAARTEEQIWDAISRIDLRFRRVVINCKTQICKVETEVIGDRDDLSKEIAPSALASVLAINDRVSSVRGFVARSSIHFVYSSELDPAHRAVMEAMER